MQFKEVIGHQQVKEQLVQMVQQNRLSHALLFRGKEGSGGLPLALAFSQYVVCSSAKENNKIESSLFGEETPTSNLNPDSYRDQTLNDSCGICPACNKANKL